MAIIRMNFNAATIRRSVSPVVYLPDFNGWNDIRPPYPTLYFLNGYSGGGLETSQFTNFYLFCMRYGIAMVLPDGENSFYVDDEKRDIRFSEYVGRELVEKTRQALPLSRKREETFIGGISMGGYGAIINGLRFPQTFGKIAALSPALGIKTPDDRQPDRSPCYNGEVMETLGPWKEYVGSYKDYEAAARKAAQSPGTAPELFIACGRQDPIVYESSRDFAAALPGLGLRSVWWEEDGGHDHPFWKRALTPACEFLSGKKV